MSETLGEGRRRAGVAAMERCGYENHPLGRVRRWAPGAVADFPHGVSSEQGRSVDGQATISSGIARVGWPDRRGGVRGIGRRLRYGADLIRWRRGVMV